MKNLISAALSIFVFSLLMSIIFPFNPAALGDSSGLEEYDLEELADAEMAAVLGGGWTGAACDALDSSSRNLMRWGSFLGWGRIVGEGAKLRGLWIAYCV